MTDSGRNEPLREYLDAEFLKSLDRKPFLTGWRSGGDKAHFIPRPGPPATFTPARDPLLTPLRDVIDRLVQEKLYEGKAAWHTPELAKTITEEAKAIYDSIGYRLEWVVRQGFTAIKQPTAQATYGIASDGLYAIPKGEPTYTGALMHPETWHFITANQWDLEAIVAHIGLIAPRTPSGRTIIPLTTEAHRVTCARLLGDFDRLMAVLKGAQRAYVAKVRAENRDFQAESAAHRTSEIMGIMYHKVAGVPEDRAYILDSVSIVHPPKRNFLIHNLGSVGDNLTSSPSSSNLKATDDPFAGVRYAHRELKPFDGALGYCPSCHLAYPCKIAALLVAYDALRGTHDHDDPTTAGGGADDATGES